MAATPRNYSQHKDYCSSALNGALVALSSREKQMLVGGAASLGIPYTVPTLERTAAYQISF